MTFRPSDDVLEELADSQNSQSWTSQYYAYNNGYNNAWNQWIWQQDFHEIQNIDGNSTENIVPTINIPVEEVKAPDLSELLQKNGMSWTDIDVNEGDVQTIDNTVLQNWWWGSLSENSVNNSGSGVVEQKNLVQQNIIQSPNISQDDLDLLDSNEITDIERSKLVSKFEWAVNWNLDFLVDEKWFETIEKYKKIHRLLFRWWVWMFIMVIWIVLWVLVDIYMNLLDGFEMVKDSSIQNKDKWIENTSDKILSPLIDSGVDLNVELSYWSASIKWDIFQSKGNLLLYKWIILPQLSSVNYKADNFMSLDMFDDHEVTRKDLEDLLKILVTDSYVLSEVKDLPDASTRLWKGEVFQWSLIDWFHLWCLENQKFSDFVCDQFLWNFYKYGKYYDLSRYAIDILALIKELRSQNKDIGPICDMIIEYTEHSWVIYSDVLANSMEYCSDESRDYYKKLINFIIIENSLKQPEISDEVFDYPDLNAYKLLSVWQGVYKILWWTSLNENYIKSYLSFVQKLLDKDKGNNRYLEPVYKDLLYVFNSDELYWTLSEKWKLTTELKLKIDQINNWNPLLWYPSLLSQLTTPNLEIVNWDIDTIEIDEKTIEDIFYSYYYMKDRLKIRKVSNVSDDSLRIQTELFTNRILSVTDDETLKLTVLLYKKWNVLYVSNIKVANQPKLTDILNIYVWNWNVSFNAMLAYIDDQIWMWYQDPTELEDENPTFCEQIQEREDISVYACDESAISLYKWEVEYNFTLENGSLNSFTIGDEDLNNLIKDKLEGVIFTRDNTPTIIVSIIDFKVELKDDNIQKKIDLVDQFRIHFKMVPDDIHDIDWMSDDFLVDLTLWEFKIQANYNVDTHLLTKISYVNCGKTLEIRWLSIPITTDNESKLVEILNNPRVFLTQSNPAAYKKYQRMCDDEKEKKQ